MAFITGTKQFGSGSETIDKDYKRTHGRGYTVMVSLDPDAGDNLETALGLAPRTGSSYPGLPFLWLSRRTPRLISRRLAEVDLEFDMRPTGTPPDQELTPNPVDWAFKWLGSSVEKISRVMYKDKDGEPVKMTNGELYATPVYEHINLLVTRYRKYYWLVLPIGAPPGTLAIDDYLLYWNNSINDATYRTKPAENWLLSVSAVPTQVNNYEVVELTYELRYNPLGWVEERLQHGSYYLDDTLAEQVTFRSPDDGTPTTGDLDADGDIAGTRPFYVKHRGSYEERDFDDLGF